MAPVIRISDEVFRRLQEIAKPLVDTPNSVIARLLESVDRRSDERPELQAPATQPPNQVLHEAPTVGFGVFLAPASIENIRISIDALLDVEEICRRITPPTCARLREVVNGGRKFHCWAMTENSRATFAQMRRGDIVLLSSKNTGRFEYRGSVLGTLESAELGNAIWPVAPGLPWSLIYVLENVHRVAVRKSQLNAELGYSRSYRVPGVIRVNPDAVERAIARHGSLDELLKAAG